MPTKPRKPKAAPWPSSPAPAGSTARAGTGSDAGTPDREGAELVERRHPDWVEHQIRWRWLLDSLEGGQRYRVATYGPDRKGLPLRNLYRHKREYPDPQANPMAYPGVAGYSGTLAPSGMGSELGPFPGMLGADPSATAQDDDYEYRRARTPIPEFVAEAIEQHLSKIYDQEIKRPTLDKEPARPPILKPLPPPPNATNATAAAAGQPTPPANSVVKGIMGRVPIPVPQPIPSSPVNPEAPDTEGNPADLIAWWEDVDGRGTPIDDYMRQTVAPLLMVLGCLDICLDHPKAPPGETIATRADEQRLGLDRCVASYILPQNMVWYRLDGGRYAECLVREYVDPSDRDDTDDEGNPIDPEAPDDLGDAWRQSYVRYRRWTPQGSVLYSYDGERLEETPSPYGCIPIVRLVDLPRHRTPHVGKSRYEGIAEYQREYYNRDSELILSDTLQAHPFLSGPDDFCKSDNTLSVGPGYILPMKSNPDKSCYQGWEFVSPPKDPAESLRKNKQDIVDLKDRAACLTKPAGASGHERGTVAQSGISKQLDATTGHKLLVSIAKSLAKAERQIAEYALVVLRNRPLDPAARKQIKVVYPARFELFGASEMTDNLLRLQQALSSVGEAPETEREMLQAIVRQTLVGLSDEDYRRLDAEIDLLARSKAQLREQMNEMSAGIASRHESMEGDGSAEQAAGNDPVGESGGTMVSNITPIVN